ncbi:hypothetical protein DMB66_00345 [Actinoplanes sp. ATCC 53533]|uniref:hypothetical protein n=1 Tax=Actinoplanes sp. ATCC 53533 TaxID=1288362 RepID=UPI000F768CE2|nr:hypothetical protein [Actinoplanes sp. ATCC 53533]RSM74834.1 hypothetical protein DMB66_00345 [Actinoplanes sp. ATCC 53533]
MEWSGPDRGIADAVGARLGIRFLYWSDAVGDLDLRRTRLRTVRLAGAELRSVRLPRSIETVLLRDPPAGLQVEAPDEGSRVDLRLFQDGSDVVIPTGLRRVSTVWLRVGGEVSAAVLETLSELRDLTLTFNAPPGIITDLAHLPRQLRTLKLDDAYGLDPDALPELPRLRSLVLHGTRRTTATTLRRRFTHGPVTLSVDGAKSERWLAEHMDNPFRDWVEESTAFGRAACAAYTRAQQAISAIAPEAADRSAAGEQALRDLVADLNTINSEHELIDTILREQAWNAFRELAGRLSTPDTRAAEWFDQDRRF